MSWFILAFLVLALLIAFLRAIWLAGHRTKDPDQDS